MPAKRPGQDGLLLLSGVGHSFGDLKVLEGIDLALEPQQRLGVVGPSGCGKTTLLEIIAGLQQPSSGSCSIGGASAASDRLRSCVLMPQRDSLLPWRNALDNTCIALENRGLSRSAARSEAQPLFERFGLASFEEAKPYELSGGMRQRITFIRTLLSGKELLLLDEPFGSLDSITRADMQEWLKQALAGDPRTVVLVTHDVEEALYLCDRVAVFATGPGRVAEEIECHFGGSSRAETITSPRFSELKHRALDALKGTVTP